MIPTGGFQFDMTNEDSIAFKTKTLVGGGLIMYLNGSKLMGDNDGIQFDIRLKNPQLANRVNVKLNHDGSYQIEYWEFRTSTRKYQEVSRMCARRDSVPSDKVRATLDEDLVERDQNKFAALASRTKVPHS